MSSYELIAIYFPWVYPVFVFIIGLCVGSFLNVCIYRMPRDLSVVMPGSFCPKSQKPLLWWENIPLLSFILLGGKGRISKEPIGWQYPVVELLTGVMFLILWLLFTPAVAIALMIMVAMFIAGSFIDWQFKIIPDTFTIGGAIVGLLVSFAVPALHGVAAPEAAWSVGNAFLALGISLQGMLIGSALILWMAILAELALKKEAMGFGDVKLLGMIGAFLGWQGAVFTIFGGAVVGMVVALVMLAVERLQGKKEAFFGREIPFGPMLNMAALAYVWLRPEVTAYWNAFVGSLNG
jgi:leader peptidase (prepilin peptidase) / N-methyltransferase